MNNIEKQIIADFFKPRAELVRIIMCMDKPTNITTNRKKIGVSQNHHKKLIKKLFALGYIKRIDGSLREKKFMLTEKGLNAQQTLRKMIL